MRIKRRSSTHSLTCPFSLSLDTIDDTDTAQVSELTLDSAISALVRVSMRCMGSEVWRRGLAPTGASEVLGEGREIEDVEETEGFDRWFGMLFSILKKASWAVGEAVVVVQMKGDGSDGVGVGVLGVGRQRQEDERGREEMKTCFWGKLESKVESCCEAVFSATTKTYHHQITMVNEMA